MRALHDARLLPDAICGTSAGSIVASFCCCRNDSELARDLYDDSALSNNLKCFESTPWECLKRLYKHGACYDSERWMDIARWFANDAAIQNMTFLEAFERSGRALAITVCATGKKAPPVLFTHKTSRTSSSFLRLWLPQRYLDSYRPRFCSRKILLRGNYGPKPVPSCISMEVSPTTSPPQL